MGFSRFTHTFPPSIPAKLSSHAVTVVPTFAPMMTFMACRRVIRPELTKPTTITVVADELWITAVMARPVRKPVNTRPVIRSSSVRSLPPARRSSDWPIRSMPNRNRHRPPIIVSTSKILILFSPVYSFSYFTHS